MSDTLTKPRVELRNLSTIGLAIGLTHYAYRAGDHTAADLLQPGYWNDAAATGPGGCDVIHEGDWIFVSGPRWALQLYVVQSSPRVVVSLLTACGALGDLPGPDFPDGL